MTEPADHEAWPARALSTLDSLWALDTRMHIIQNRLTHMLGYFPTAHQVRDAANRFRDLPVAAPIVQAKPISQEPGPTAEEHAGPTPAADDHTALDPYRLSSPPPMPDKVVLVAPRTFPANRFSMLGGRIR